MIRRAAARDTADVVRLMRDFHAVTQPPFAFSPAHVSTFFHGMLADPDSLVLAYDLNGGAKGILAAKIFDHAFADFRMASELAWWIDPAHRGRGVAMIRAYESWAVERGAHAIALTEISTMPVAAIYRRLGYTLTEATYVKAVR